MSAQPSLLDRTLVALTLIILVALPLPVGSNRTWAIGLFTLLIGAATLLWAIGQWRGVFKESRALRPALPMLAMLLLTQLWVAVQWLGGLSMDSGASAQALIIGVGYTLLFLLVINLFHTRKRVSLLLGTLVVSGTLQAFYGSFVTLSGFEGLFGQASSSTTGTFINRNSLAGYLGLTLSAGIGLLLALRDNSTFSWVKLVELLMGPKARLRLALVIMVIALVMTHSRGGNASFFVGLLIVGSVFVLRTKENRTRNILILASVVLIDVLVISQYFGLERLKDRVMSTQLMDKVVISEVVETDAISNELIISDATRSPAPKKPVQHTEVIQKSTEIRGDVFLQALPLALDKPIIGQGAGSFEAVFPQYAGDDIRLHFDLAHNDYIQFAIEYGALGLVPLVLFVLMGLSWAFKAIWQQRSLYRGGVGFGAAMGIITMLAHATVDFNLQIPANAATFVVLCALAVLAKHHRKDRRKAIEAL